MHLRSYSLPGSVNWDCCFMNHQVLLLSEAIISMHASFITSVATHFIAACNLYDIFRKYWMIHEWKGWHRIKTSLERISFFRFFERCYDAKEVIHFHSAFPEISKMKIFLPNRHQWKGQNNFLFKTEPTFTSVWR